MTDADPPDQLLESALALLAEGPMQLDELVARLDRAGRLEVLRAEGVDDSDMAEVASEEILYTDAIWSSTTGVLALSSLLTDGLVLTHRLTAEEIASGEVVLTPDLVVLDWDERGGLELGGGGTLVHHTGARIPGEDNTTLAGPDGWLGGFGIDDVVAFIRSGRSVRVEPAGSLDDDRHEVALLAGTVDGRIPLGDCEESVPLILDALTADPEAFRRPVRPLGELLQAAGLEQRGFAFGRAGDQWLGPAESHYRRELDRLADVWGFDRCCRAAFEETYQALGETQRGGDIDARSVAASLSHGTVAPALADYCVSLERTAALADLAAAVIAGSPRHWSGALLLVAQLADDRGDALGAEAALRQALRDDPTYGPAAADLAHYELDRGELTKAVALLRHDDLNPDSPMLAFLEDFRRRLDAPYAGVGRNERCPCGSGRKFKVCCANGRVPPLSARTELVTRKLALFALGERHRSRLVGIASSACDPDDPDLMTSIGELADSPIIIDFAIWEGGIAEDYLMERGELLPADERQLIEELLDQRRRLWEVTSVDPGTGMTLRDTATGDQVVVTEHLGSLDREDGELFLGRVARLADQNQLMGMPLTVPLRLRDSALRLVDAAQDADGLAMWYGHAIAFPTMVNFEQEPIVLCHAEVTTDLSLAALHAALDPVLDRLDDGEWCEHLETTPHADQDEQVDLDLLDDPFEDPADGLDWEVDDDEEWGEKRTLRGTVELEDGRLLVDTNSIPRVDRLLATITAAVPDAEVVVDQRSDIRSLMAAMNETADPDADELPPAPSEEMDALLDSFIRTKEAEWVDESIPALGGLTPRQALDDPTRREDLLALLREMDGHSDLGGGRGFDAGRLRSLLGIAPND